MSKKICTYPGCRNIVEGGGNRCPQHPQLITPKRHYDHHFHNGKNIYSTAWWKRLRELQLIEQPLCEICMRRGITVPATVVDHIEEVEDGGAIDDLNNLQSLCRACHNAKTAQKARDRKRKGEFPSPNDFK